MARAILSHGWCICTATYQLLAGEVVIIRQGRLVDLIEAGESLGEWGWPDAIAVAWRDTVLATND